MIDPPLSRLAEHLAERPHAPLPPSLVFDLLDDPALRTRVARVQRDAALRLAAAMLDPHDRMAPSRLAKLLSGKLAAFHDRAWPRIVAGYREPNSPLEEVLADATAHGEECGQALSWRSLFGVLQIGLQKERARIRQSNNI